MKKIKDIKDIEDFVEFTKKHQEFNPYYPVQCDIFNKDMNKKFTTYLCDIADFIFSDERSKLRREPTELTYQEIIEKTTPSNSIKSGIKINHLPMFKIHEWEHWDDGYIEGFLNIRPKNEPDYFVWTYIKMKHLTNILENWKNKLQYYA